MTKLFGGVRSPPRQRSATPRVIQPFLANDCAASSPVPGVPTGRLGESRASAADQPGTWSANGCCGQPDRSLGLPPVDDEVVDLGRLEPRPRVAPPRDQIDEPAAGK